MYANVLSGEMLVIICGTIAVVIILIILIYIVIGIKKKICTTFMIPVILFNKGQRTNLQKSESF